MKNFRFQQIGFCLMLIQSFFMMACGKALPINMGSKTSSSENGSLSINLGDPTAVQNQALKVLSNNCVICHAAGSGPAGIYNLLDTNHLISTGLVVPGDAANSTLLQSIMANRMPPSGPLSSAEKNLLQTWIQGGAQAGTQPIPPPVIEPLAATFKSLSQNVLIPKCVGCHSETKADGGYKFDTYANTIRAVRAGSPTSSKLYTITQSGEMPPRPNVDLNSEELKFLAAWISAGAENN